jgi:hypothetical protein
VGKLPPAPVYPEGSSDPADERREHPLGADTADYLESHDPLVALGASPSTNGLRTLRLSALLSGRGQVARSTIRDVQMEIISKTVSFGPVLVLAPDEQARSTFHATCAAYVLGMLGAIDAQEDLARAAVDDLGQDVRLYCVTSLGKLRARQQLPVLKQLYAREADQQLRLMIAQAICRMTGVADYEM